MRDALLRAIADQLPVESISLGMELKDIQAKQEPGRVNPDFARVNLSMSVTCTVIISDLFAIHDVR